MNIELHITDVTPAELQKLAMVLNDGRRFSLKKEDEEETVPERITPRPKASSRPVVGFRDKERRMWPSVSACAHDLDVALSTVDRAIKDDRYMKNGWKLYYKTDEDKQTSAEGTETAETSEEIIIPEDTKAPAWSREPQPIIGIKGKEQRRWESIYQCTRELGSNYETVKKAAKRYLHVNGYMLMFEEIQK